MNFIEELYYGNINPSERDINPDSENDRLEKLVLRHEGILYVYGSAEKLYRCLQLCQMRKV